MLVARTIKLFNGSNIYTTLSHAATFVTVRYFYLSLIVVARTEPVHVGS